MRVTSLFLLAALLAHAQDYSVEKEAALGKQLAASFLKSGTLLENDELAAYVRSVGTRLVGKLEPSAPYTFTITSEWQDPPPLEAYGLPGGQVIVPSSLILAARDEAELAGALAHPIIHNAARHAIRSRGQLGQLGPIPLVYVGTFGQATPLLLPVGLLQVQRANESEADQMVVRLMSDAGYDPAGLEHYVERVQQDPARPEFSQVPPREERLRAVERGIASLPKQTYSASEDFGRIQEELRRLAPTPPPRRAPTLVG